jgi:FkbM family methyltransferase
MTARTALLGGVLAGTCLGGAVGFFAGRGSVNPVAPSGSASASASSSLTRAEPTPAPTLVANSFPRLSFAQQGEDIIMDQMVSYFGIDHPSYLDIGAHDPIIYNNTFLFYGRGSRGVLVEPNPVMVEKLRRERPNDTVLAVGIGPADVPSADYYVTRGAGLLNTFSKEDAEELKKKYGPEFIERVLKMPLVNVNRVLEEHFSNKAPDVLSIDTEGLDLPILRALDFTRFRPRIICVETLVDSTRLAQSDIVSFVTSKGYTARAGTFVNTIFVANELIAAGPAKTKEGPLRSVGFENVRQ